MKSNDRGEFGPVTVAILVILALIVAPGVVWLVSVAASPLTGAADAYKQKESAANRVFSQSYFQTTSEQIKATQVKITLMSESENLTPEQLVRQEGLRSYCVTLVSDYNSKSKAYTMSQFKDADLPVSFNATIDCEPTP